jgi:DNA-binding transcriptional MocR family regulator
VKTTPPNENDLTRKSLLILQMLRQNAREHRNKKPQTFYSIRAVANHFGVPPTTVSSIYRQLRSKGLLTTVWGSKTFITPTRINSELRVRGVVALPAPRTSFCTLRDYRNFFSEMRDALWRFGFATQLLFYDEGDARLSTFTQRLLKERLDLVIWFLLTAKSKETIARLEE